MSKTYTMSINKNRAKANEKEKLTESRNIKSAKNRYEIEKNILASQKKQVKNNLSEVKSYADIVLGKRQQKVVAITVKKVSDDEIIKEKSTKNTVNKVVEKEKTVANVLKMPEINDKTRTSNIIAEVSERMTYEYDSDAQRVVNVARMGSLFDYLN